MGYCIDVECSVKFSKKNKSKVKQIFKELDLRPEKYHWVTKGFSQLPSIKEMFEEWRYEIEEDDDFYIVECFSGEKLGDDKILWKALSSVVEPDSILEFTGEDGNHWKYTFKNNKFKESHGTVEYEDDEPKEKPAKKQKAETNIYAVLGIKKSSSKAEIEAAYKAKMKKYHPDNFQSMDEDFVELAKTKSQELGRAKDEALKNLK